MRQSNIFSKILIPLAAIVVLSIIFIHPVNAVSDSYECEDANGSPIVDRTRLIKVAIPIPGFVNEITCYESKEDAATGQITKVQVLKYYYVESLSQYISNLYQYFVGIVGILAAVMIMYGGIRWIFAAGNQSRIQGAKNVIFSAVIGVVIAFSSYLLLYLLNPRTVDFFTLQSTLNATPVKGIAQDSEFCKDVDNSAVIDPVSGLSATQFIFHIIEQGSEALGNVSPTTSENGADYYCGDQVGVLARGQEYKTGISVPLCRGSKCPSSGQLCQKTGVGVYDCISTFLYGDIEWPTGTNMYVDRIELVPVCVNGKVPSGSGLLEGGDLNQNVTEEATFYTFPFTGGGDIRSYAQNLRLKMQDCVRTVTGNDTPEAGRTDISYFAGFYMDVEVNDDTSFGFTDDDNYAVGTSCAPISTKAPNKLTEDEWKQLIDDKQLIDVHELFYDPTNNLSPEECKANVADGIKAYDNCLLKSKSCTLNINRQQYPAR